LVCSIGLGLEPGQRSQASPARSIIDYSIRSINTYPCLY
jgi:hypothetical protein